MDYDTYSANDAIGKVYVDLNPLLLPQKRRIHGAGSEEDSSKGATMAGWLPIYDTIHGVINSN